MVVQSGIALFLGAIAIFQERIRAYFYHPVFSITPSDCVPTHSIRQGGFVTTTAGFVTTQGGFATTPALSFVTSIDLIFFQISVENVGKETAHQVEVYAEKLERKRADGSWKSVTEFPPMNLVWSYHPDSVYSPLISPDMSKLCDIAYIIDPAKRASNTDEENDRLNLQSDQACLAFNLIAKPQHKGHIVGPGTYRLGIAVTAENIRKPLRKWVVVEFPAQWDFDPAQMGLKIDVLNR